MFIDNHISLAVSSIMSNERISTEKISSKIYKQNTAATTYRFIILSHFKKTSRTETFYARQLALKLYSLYMSPQVDLLILKRIQWANISNNKGAMSPMCIRR